MVAQQALAVVALLEQADPGCIAIHSTAFVVLVAPAVVGVVVTLRIPMFCSISRLFQDNIYLMHISFVCKAYHTHHDLAT